MTNTKGHWHAYYQATQTPRPRPHLVQALEHFEPTVPRTAIDVGCGTGRDTLFLAGRGFRVTAFDSEPDAVETVLRQVGERSEVRAVQARFDTFDYHPVGLVNASASLFFCEAPVFDDVWCRIRNSILPDGLFCGQLLGPEDSWCSMERFDGNALDRARLDDLFRGFEILNITERNGPGTTALGNPKHWHYWTVIARKTEGGCTDQAAMPE